MRLRTSGSRARTCATRAVKPGAALLDDFAQPRAFAGTRLRQIIDGGGGEAARRDQQILGAGVGIADDARPAQGLERIDAHGRGAGEGCHFAGPRQQLLQAPRVQVQRARGGVGAPIGEVQSTLPRFRPRPNCWRISGSRLRSSSGSRRLDSRNRWLTLRSSQMSEPQGPDVSRRAKPVMLAIIVIPVRLKQVCRLTGAARSRLMPPAIRVI